MRVPSVISVRRARGAAALAALLAASLLATALPPGTRASTPVGVVASGSIQTGPSSSSTFRITASDDGAGSIEGWLEVSANGPLVSGPITCLVVAGNQVAAGMTGVSGGDIVHATVFLTDNGEIGTADTAAIVGPSGSGPPDCGAPRPPEQPLWYGQVTVLVGASDSGSVSGQGTSALGFSMTRTFDFDAQRAPDGSVTGTFSITESGGFSIAGTVVCLDIRGSRAMVIGQGPNPNYPMGGGPYRYATFFVEDGGPNGSGDGITVNAYSESLPSPCLAARESPFDGLITGDIDVNGAGGGGGPTPAATLVATGSVNSMSGSETFEVTAISDGAGSVDGLVQFSRYGTPFQGSVTCLAVSGTSAVVGAVSFGNPTTGSMTLYATLWLTDGGSDASVDSIAIDGPTNMAVPDCSLASPPQQSLSYGQVTLLGPSEPGFVDAAGTQDLGSGWTRTFDIDATRTTAGTVSGTFSVVETSGFSLNGGIDCLHVAGNRAFVIGHGTYAGGGGGPQTLYATVFVEDWGAGGAGDLIAFNAYRQVAPFGCAAAQESPGGGLASGNILVTAGGPEPSPQPSETPGPTPEPSLEPSPEPTPATYTVTTADDLPGGTCADPCSLRQAIGAANARPGLDRITFAIGSGPVVIAVDTALPTITDSVSLEGALQPGPGLLPRVAIDGGAAPAGTHGLVAQGPIAISVEALEIRHFPGHGVLLDGTVGSVIGGAGSAQGSVIHHNGLDGVAVVGATAIGNDVLGTLLYDNGGLAVDLGDDGDAGVGCPFGEPPPGSPNDGQCAIGPASVEAGPAPELTASFTARPGPIRVEFFWAPDCRFDGSLVAQARELVAVAETVQSSQPWGAGSVTATSTRALAGGFVTATVTSVSGTSELTQCVMVGVPTDLAVAFEPPAAPAWAGEPTVISFTVTNEGPLAHEGAIAALDLRDGIATYQTVQASVPATCSIAGGVAACFGLALDVGMSATITTTLVAPDPGPIQLQALAFESFGGLDPDPLDNVADLTLDMLADADGDGIDDALQPAGTPSGSFSDASLVPPTEGAVVSANGLKVEIVDEPAPDGVRVIVGPGAAGTSAELAVCGGVTVLVAAGSELVGTCGSVTLSVVAGDATVVLGGGLTLVGIPAGGSARIVDNGDGTYGVTNLAQPGQGPAITVTVDGVSTQIAAGGTVTAAAWDFVGFLAPVNDAPVLNVIRAGQAAPLKWRLVDADGAAIVDLATATVTVTSLACGLGTTPDLVEELAAGSSGLQNLGNGYYQLNWKSPKAYAGSCKTLRLDIGDGVLHDALFKFQK